MSDLINDIVHQLSACTVEELEEVGPAWLHELERMGANDKIKAFSKQAISLVVSAKLEKQAFAV